MLWAPTFLNAPIYKLHWGGILIRKKSDFLHPIFYHVLHPIFIAVAEFEKNKDRLAAKLVHRSRNHPGGVDSMAFGSPLVVYPWKSPPFGSIKVQDVQAPTG